MGRSSPAASRTFLKIPWVHCGLIRAKTQDRQQPAARRGIGPAAKLEYLYSIAAGAPGARRAIPWHVEKHDRPMTSSPSDLALWVALSLIPGLGGRTFDRLLARFGTLDAVLIASEPDLRAVPGIGPTLSAAIRAIDLARTRQEIAAWQADGIAILTREDAQYPEPLRRTEDAPPVVFWRGHPFPGDPAVALVGTRWPSAAAGQLAGQLAETLAAQGWLIVSGLAAGIDTAAHWGALRAGGRTVAVLGSGVQAIYPPQNADLAARILERGALLGETHPLAPPSSPALVARNRLISGLSRAVIVVATEDRGGSLHTTRFAQQQGRPVYAVDNQCAGNRQLLADGARPLAPQSAAWDEMLAELADLP
jgi:DNA processing protein